MERHIEEPFVHCLSAGKNLNALCVTLEFEVDMPRDGQKNELTYRAFFIDGANDIVSDIKELRLVSGEVVKSTFTLTAKASSSSQCMLALQSEIDNADELQQMIPFQVNISFTADFDF